MQTIFDIFTVTFEMACCFIFMGTFSNNRRKGTIITLTAWFVVLVASMYITAYFLRDFIIIKIFACIIVTTVLSYLVFDMSVFRLAVCAACFYGIDALWDCILYSIIAKPFPQHPEIIYYVMIIFSRLLLLFTVLFIRLRVKKTGSSPVNDRLLIGILSMPIITIISGTAVVLRVGKVEQPFWLTAISVGLAIINILVFVLVEAIFIREKKVRNAQLQYEKVKNEMKMYYSISENLDRQRKWSHEFKNHLSCVKELVENADFDGLKLYLGSIDEELSKRADMVNTNNVIVNAIINTKYREAMEKGIVFVLKVNDLSDISLSDMDVVTILSNLLNNAFEACEKCEEKIIKLKFVKEKRQTVIAVKNSMTGKPVENNGFFETTKTDDSEEHGLGIKNVCEVLEKYNAKYQIECSGGEFSFTIVIQDQ